MTMSGARELASAVGDAGPTLDEDQALAARAPGGRVKVLGGPGTGKTTILMERAAWLVARGVDPAGVLFLVRDRRVSMDRRDALVRRLGRSTAGPGVFTFHALAWSLLTRAFPVLGGDATADVGYQLAGFDEEPVLLTAFDQRAFVRQLLLEEDARAWPVNAGLLGSPSFAGEVRDFLLRAQEQLLSPLDVERLAAERERPDWAELAAFYRRYTRAVQDPEAFEDARPRLDFAMVLSEARRMLGEHPRVAEDLHDLYPHLLVDDFEEANRAEAALLDALLPGEDRPDRSAVVAGDPGGGVFAFRGADPGCLEALEATEVRLSTRHRVGADPRVRLYAHTTDEARGIVAELRGAAAAGVAYGDMAVITRDYRALLAPLRRELKRAGVPHRVEGEAVALVRDPVVRPVLDLFEVACERQGHEELWPTLATSELGGLSVGELVQVRRAARLAQLSLGEACRGHAGLDAAPELTAKLARLCGLLADAARWAEEHPPDECFWLLWRRADWFAHLVEAGDERRLDSLTTLSDAMARFTERRGTGARMRDFLDTLMSAEFAPTSIRLTADNDAVTVATAHSSKGREFALAVVAGCVEGLWPDPSRPGLLLDSDLLAGPADPAERQRRAMAEEERLFALAVSRAPRLIVTGQRSGGSERLSAEPSRFLEGLGADLPEANETVPDLVLTAREAEVSWRALVADPGQPAEDRLAALWALVRLPGVNPDRWWGGRPWTENGTPVVGLPKRTSYSRFSDYENCPLAYLLGQVLGLDPERTYHMAFGSLIHGLLEDVEAGKLPKQPEALIEEARRRWRDEDYPPGAVANYLWRDCQEILRRYLALEADNGHRALRTEQFFAFPIKDWTVRGRIDRIDALDRDGLRLIDYKTSNHWRSDDEAADDLQLATYFLACARDEELRSLGRAKCAELLYVRHERGRAIRRATQSPKRGADGSSWDVVTEGRITTMLDAIDREQFAPNPEAECRFCSFKELCPMWPEGEELRPRAAAASGRPA